jgi:hypothetical protein
MKSQRSAIQSLLVGTAMALSGAAQASLVSLGPSNFQGTGLGAVNTVLTIHDNDGTEEGSVSLVSAGVQFETGNTTAITSVRSFAELGFTPTSGFQVIFNPAEPGNADNPILLESLVLSIFSPTGTVLFSSGPLANAPLLLDPTDLGIGNAGFAFGLDSAQTTAAFATAFGANFNAGNVVGLAASVSQAQGGPETFFVVEAPIPEPETYALMLAGLGLMGFVARRRSREVTAV